MKSKLSRKPTAPVLPLSSLLGREAAARSSLYSFLSSLLTPPDEELYAWLQTGELTTALHSLVAELPYPLLLPELSAELPPFTDLHSHFLACFEIGLSGPACPLYEGVVRGEKGRKAIMEDALRFYHFFGVKLSSPIRELPDHLSAELEFMHYLTFREAELLEQEGEDAQGRASLLRGQRDFLERHLLNWVPALEAKARRVGAPEFYCSLLTALAGFLQAEREYLEKQIEETEAAN